MCEITDEVVWLCNRHSKTHDSRCQRPPDYICRGRFPRELVAFSCVDLEDGYIRLRHDERWLNTFNIVVTYLFRCNTDASSLLTGTQVKAVIAYVSDYVRFVSQPL